MGEYIYQDPILKTVMYKYGFGYLETFQHQLYNPIEILFSNELNIDQMRDKDVKLREYGYIIFDIPQPNKLVIPGRITRVEFEEKQLDLFDDEDECVEIQCDRKLNLQRVYRHGIELPPTELVYPEDILDFCPVQVDFSDVQLMELLESYRRNYSVRRN